MILLTHQKSTVSFQTPNQITPVCISVRASLALDDLYRGDGSLLQSNSHPKWLGRRVVQREIMCLLWTLMTQWKRTNDPHPGCPTEFNSFITPILWKLGKLLWVSFFRREREGRRGCPFFFVDVCKSHDERRHKRGNTEKVREEEKKAWRAVIKM